MTNNPDKGHEALIEDLTLLLEQAKAKRFHDFLNETEVTPKVALVLRLDELMMRVKQGKYDN